LTLLTSITRTLTK